MCCNVQDDEYLASLQADQEKEMKAKAEAEARLIEQEAARVAALEEERRKEEEAYRKLVEEQVPFFPVREVLGYRQSKFVMHYLLI